jgi:hypothetical protein
MSRFFDPIKTLAAVVGLALLGLASPAAQAGLLPGPPPVSVSGPDVDGYYTFTYSVVLPSSQFIIAGDFFTIHDFNGFVPGTNAQPGDWDFASPGEGPFPFNPGPPSQLVKPDDDKDIPNLNWTYKGNKLSAVGSDFVVGLFSAKSIYGDKGPGSFTSQIHRSFDDLVDVGGTPTDIPVPPGHAPEPTALLMMGIGLPLLGAYRLYRRRQLATI